MLFYDKFNRILDNAPHNLHYTHHSFQPHLLRMHDNMILRSDYYNHCCIDRDIQTNRHR